GTEESDTSLGDGRVAAEAVVHPIEARSLERGRPSPAELVVRARVDKSGDPEAPGRRARDVRELELALHFDEGDPSRRHLLRRNQPAPDRLSHPKPPPAETATSRLDNAAAMSALGARAGCQAAGCAPARPRGQTVTRASSSIDVRPDATFAMPSSHSVFIPDVIASRATSSRLALRTASSARASFMSSSWKI